MTLQQPLNFFVVLAAFINSGFAPLPALRNNPAVQFVIRAIRGLVLAAFALGFQASAQANLPVYSDSFLNGFEQWNWMSPDLSNTWPVHSGANSIRVSGAAAWQGLAVHHAKFDTRPYTSLSFWVNGGTNGGQRLQVQGVLSDANPLPDVYYRFTAPTDAWQRITVPLTSLEVADKTNCTGFWIEVTPDGAGETFYVDDIELNGRPEASTAGPAAPPPAVTAVATAPPETSLVRNAAIWCIVGALVVITGMLAWLMIMLHRGGLGTSRALVPASAGPAARLDSGDALEPSTDPQMQALRERMAAELAEFAKQSLVQGLYSQRSQLVEMQRKAQQEIAELEARLASLHLPLQERIRAYEARIAELESELATRDAEMRDMIQTTLAAVRERLAAEQGQAEASRFN